MTEAAVTIDERGPVLLGLARQSIASAFGETFDPAPAAEWLSAEGASFVTLTRVGKLRGCIGSVEPRRPLLDDVKVNARMAAFYDPRFPPLAAREFPTTRIEVSLLSPLELASARSQAEALALIRPHVDGVVLEEGRRRATFLPQVWELLPDAGDFLGRLRLKAGLPSDFWSDDLRLYRYQVTKWSEPESRGEA